MGPYSVSLNAIGILMSLISVPVGKKSTLLKIWKEFNRPF